MLQDSFGRIHDYLRISLTDHCNFRCSYCMPVEEMEWMPSSKLMSKDEILNLAETFISLGVKKIRLTGGEPLVRKEFPEILERLASFPVELTLTTNGVLIDKHIENLKKAGVRSVNVSLDTLNREKFLKLTRRDQFDQVWNNILLLLQEDFRVKVNAVAIHGVIEEEICDFLKITEKLPLHVRFIEFMPFAGNHWQSKKVVTAAQMLELVKKDLEVIKLEDKKHDTAKKYQVPGFAGTFAFITTMSEHFCGECNRMRLTADGKIKNCLFGKEELDLLGALRKGEAVESLIRLAVSRKHAALGGQFSQDYLQANPDSIENRSMINIGG
ncbi:GTP 3',8-cyclase MoaA [Algoriphagus boritolerans]|uniref:GTP 3',8-cyclase n=1 Tax=Algoriphagus boritolerans DSM 17298 = JCM 18970 TaxID=1120964 RepID=A0A1H5RXD5_9BACT|nr:GTP 3',8-cyclase MoaA [Algoriphagus boritolerans]SEF42784.1 cyclic pyranopterin phosphate synthase [Algoriphagus boritolerans DSM 17298 = JCM 18970]